MPADQAPLGRKHQGYIEVAAVTTIAGTNLLLNRTASRSAAIAIGLAAAAGMLALASARGASTAQMGLSSDKALRGAARGALLGVPVAAAMLLGARIPTTRRFFRDERIVSANLKDAAYELLVRMPLVTAVGEELMFRAAFEGLLSRRHSATSAALLSAVAFALWHVLPTLDRVHSNPGVAETHQGSMARQALVVAAVLGATGIASLGLSLVQRRTGSVVAPIILHYAINASGFAAGWLTHRAELSGAFPGG